MKVARSCSYQLLSSIYLEAFNWNTIGKWKNGNKNTEYSNSLRFPLVTDYENGPGESCHYLQKNWGIFRIKNISLWRMKFLCQVTLHISLSRNTLWPLYHFLQFIFAQVLRNLSILEMTRHLKGRRYVTVKYTNLHIRKGKSSAKLKQCYCELFLNTNP